MQFQMNSRAKAGAEGEGIPWKEGWGGRYRRRRQGDLATPDHLAAQLGTISKIGKNNWQTLAHLSA